MNEMLERLDRANQRQQRFVADTSHELVARSHACAPSSSSTDATRTGPMRRPRDAACSTTSAILQRLIDDLLQLARSDAGVRRWCAGRPRRHRARRGPRRRDIDVRDVSAAQVHGDGAALRRVVRNLLDNARRHAASEVKASLAEIDDTARLVIDDDGRDPRPSAEPRSSNGSAVSTTPAHQAKDAAASASPSSTPR